MGLEAVPVPKVPGLLDLGHELGAQVARDLLLPPPLGDTLSHELLKDGKLRGSFHGWVR